MANPRKAKDKSKRAASAKRKTKTVARRARGKAKSWPKQNFTVSHHNDADFDAGLRAYFAYRDLGIAKATKGKVRAHVIRMTQPFDGGEVAIPHYHDVEFQMVYVLKGWFTTDLQGQGPITMKAGSCWIQPPKIKHTVVGYSDDCELLEIVLPADFKTVTLTK
jgi:quercetin dioxygenase-like cupin family protein